MSVRSLLGAAKIESGPIRWAVGGLAGGTGALVATSITESTPLLLAVTGVLAFVLYAGLGLAYNVFLTES